MQNKDNKVAKCEICGKKFTSIGADYHRKTTGHNDWDLIVKKRKPNAK